MKISGILTFIILLLTCILGIVTSMGVEVVLKTGTVYLISFIVLILLAIIVFILALQNKKKSFGVVNIILIVSSIIMLFVSRHFAIVDYIAHPTLAINNGALIIFFIATGLSIIFGIINAILVYMNKVA